MDPVTLGSQDQQNWILDVISSENSSRIREENSPEISSVSRRLALGVLQTVILQLTQASKISFGANVSVGRCVTR
jgi:hypothetical protein